MKKDLNQIFDIWLDYEKKFITVKFGSDPKSYCIIKIGYARYNQWLHTEKQTIVMFKGRILGTNNQNCDKTKIRTLSRNRRLKFQVCS